MKDFYLPSPANAGNVFGVGVRMSSFGFGKRRTNSARQTSVSYHSCFTLKNFCSQTFKIKSNLQLPVVVVFSYQLLLLSFVKLFVWKIFVQNHKNRMKNVENIYRFL